MYGEGLVARSTRYTSRAEAVQGVSNRCEGTTWNASPARMRSLMSSTAARYASPPHSPVKAGSSDSGRASGGAGTGRARSVSIASSRATASAYASSTPLSRSLWLMALAISRTEPSQWSRTARSEVRSMVSSGTRRSSRPPSPTFSRRRTMS